MSRRLAPKSAAATRARARRPASAVAWVIVGTTVLLCFAVVPRLRETSVQATTNLLKRGFDITEEEGPGGAGSLLHMPYQKWYENTPVALRPLFVAFLILVLIFLFCSISITASDFFCPNLASMAAYLGLSETTAGVTLLAFGNGSPDVFSTFVAMREDSFGLAAGELIGAASFITSIVVGCIAMVQPFHVPPFAFLRDVSFFLMAVLLLLWVLKDGHLTLHESGAMMSLYGVYVGVVVASNWWQTRQRRKAEYAQLGWKAPPRDEEETEPTVDPVPIEPQLTQPPSPTLAPPAFSAGRFGRRASSASLHTPVAEHGFGGPLSHSVHVMEDSGGATPRAGFSLLGAVEFRDVVNSLRQSGDLPTPGSSRGPSRPNSPMRSPLEHPEGAGGDYFFPTTHHHHHHHRRSSSQGLAAIEPALSRRHSMGRSRSSSLHPAWSARTSRQSTLESPSRLEPVPASPHDSDEGVEHIPLSTSKSPKQPPTLTLDTSNHGEPGAPRPVSPPHISLVDPDGASAEPTMALSRTNTVEMVARRGLGAMRRVLHTLFPSLLGFRHKSIVGMCLAVLSVPAILMLTITLPVIDDGRTDEGGVVLPGADDEPLADGTHSDTDDDDEDPPVHPEVGDELHHLVDGGHRRRSTEFSSTFVRGGEPYEHSDASSCCEEEADCALSFNPTLTAVQCVMGPAVCGWLVFQDEPHWPWILLVSAVAGGTVGACVLKVATDGTKQPWRLIRCCCGFICSMVWIAAIADEVVAVLSTFGEIFGLSEAIVGLTSNSLADLVANVTIAQFSPNMAYAACFGGPMLNLLLGVGGSGSWKILSDPKQAPVTLTFSPTLWVSSIGLIVILATTAVVVPLNKYRIDRRWALCLLIAYFTLMTANVIVEIKSERRGRGGLA